MTDAASAIVLHNYPQSPVAEKVRKGLGLKGLAWCDVEIPRLPPKPDLVCLTGGYRRTPVLQIGADIYCDSQVILAELERRHPQPTFFPGGAQGMAVAVSRWSDGELFDLAVKIILGAAGDGLPADFAADRGRLYLGPDWAERLKAAHADLPHLTAQMRAHLGFVDDRLSKGRDFMLGTAPGLPDLLVWHVVWFLRGRWADGPGFLDQFANLTAWEARMAGLGQGSFSPMTAEDAIAVARANAIAVPEAGDPGDPQGLAPGQREGTVRVVARDRVTIVRSDPRAGEVSVTFPRTGYRVTPLSAPDV